MRILTTSPLIPRPDTASGERRFFCLLSLLAARAQVDFVSGEASPAAGAAEVRYLTAVERLGVQVLPGGLESMHDRIARQPYDVVLAEFWQHAEFVGRLVRRIQPWARLVVDTVDVHFLREETGLRFGRLDAATVAERKARELAVYRGAEVVIVLTSDDEVALRGTGCVRPFIRIPNIVEPRERADIVRAPLLLFVGGFGHPPNLDAVRWLVTEIFPRIREQRPEARLRIVGSKPPREVLALHGAGGVEVIASAPDMTPHLDEAAVSVAPLRYGAGMKGKVTEALAAGLPVVTTSVGAQGLAAESGRHLMIADDADGFANAVLVCLADPARATELGRQGRERVLSLCGEPVAARAVDQLLALLPARSVPGTAGARQALYRLTRSLARPFRRQDSA